jgi:hypothetical protein
MLEQLGDEIDEISVSSVRIGVEQGRQLRAIEGTRIQAMKWLSNYPGRSRVALGWRLPSVRWCPG